MMSTTSGTCGLRFGDIDNGMSDEPDSLDPSLTVFPTLEALVKSYCGKRYQAHLTLITHVLPTARDYIVCLKKIFEIDVIAIPYSACPTTVEWLLDAGYSVTVPDCTENVSRIAFD